MSALKGDVRSLAKFSASLRALPRVVAVKSTEAAAPEITALAKQTFAASETPDGVPWAPGSDGQKVTLRKSGALARFITYVAIGTKLRVSLGVSYARYQIGRRRVFPLQGAPLPTSYVSTLARVAGDVIRAEIGGGR